LIRPDGFELFFNRDESLPRGEGRPPERLELGSVRVLAPRDPDAGGTWLGVNPFGLALGVLNARDQRPGQVGSRSRGLLVRDLLDARDADAALARLAREPLERYRAFVLLLLEPGREPRVRAWDGGRLAAGEARPPLCSSSLDLGRAQEERERVYARMLERAPAGTPEPELLARFQASHEPERGPWSPCMHRADAATVSATQVRVGARSVAMRYAGGPPCTTSFGPWIELERSA
jgi:hypothetical protein